MTAPPRVIEILLVEDDPGDVLLTREALEGFEVTCHVSSVGDGVKAMEFMRRDGPYAKAPFPELVLLDLNLPRKNGRQVLAEMRADPGLSHIPVIVLTTSAADEDVLQCYQLHANAYVTKPASVNELWAAVRSSAHYFACVATLPRRDQSGIQRATGAAGRQMEDQLFAEAVPHFVWLANPDGAIEYVNRRGLEYAGLTRSESLGWGWLSAIHPDDRERVSAAWTDATACDRAYEIEYRLRRADGAYRWQLVRGLPLRDSSGCTVRWIGTTTDIDDFKQTLNQLAEAHRDAVEAVTLLEVIQDSLPLGFGFVDRECRFVRCNDRLAAINGGTVNDQIGKTVEEVAPHLWRTLEPLYHRVLESGDPVVNFEWSGPSWEADGATRVWLTNLYPVRIGAEVIGIGILVVDITERNRAEHAREALTSSVVDALAEFGPSTDEPRRGAGSRILPTAAPAPSSP